LLDNIHRWLTEARSGRPPVPYEVKCPSGHPVAGLRKAHHQVVPCAQCGQRIFVLPYSPLPSPEEPGSVAAAQPPLRPWRLPAVAALFTLAIVILVFTIWLGALRSPKAGVVEDAREHIEAGKTALAEGRMRRAVEAFDAAFKVRQLGPTPLSSLEERQLRQWQRQASLLADLLSESLEEILLQAARSQPEEWLAQFAQRYKGAGKANAVVFDSEVWRDNTGKLRLRWELDAGAERARIDLGDLALLRARPLDKPTRLLFGARLASVAREPPGMWVVRFEEDSGVFLTEREAAAGCCPPPLDEELMKVLERQRQWVEGR
jgi:hypothetical protein